MERRHRSLRLYRAKYKWSDDDNLIAYCVYRFGDGVFGMDRRELGDLLGMGFNSFSLKIANHKSLDGLGGFPHVTEQDRRIFTKYSEMPDDEVRQAGNAALQRACDGAPTPQMSSSQSVEEIEEEIARIQRRIEKLQA